MNITMCEKGHYYDADMDSKCPYCEGRLSVRPELSFPRSRMDGEAPPPVCIYAAPPPGILKAENNECGKEESPQRTFFDRLKKLLRPDGRRH